MSNSDNWKIFIQGPLFEAVQSLGLFRDSKTFPDMIPYGFDLTDQDKVSKVLKRFVDISRASFGVPVNGFLGAVASLDTSKTSRLTVEELKKVTGLGNGVIEFRSRLIDLIHENFRGRPETAVTKGLPREPTCSMEAYIDSIWNLLRRDSRNLPQEMFKGTLIQLAYPYVVAGGRFEEIYYWDGYFTGEGLVLSGGLDLFHCMVKNYAAFIDTYGFIPSGNRRYYLTRSQAPVFYCMVDLIGRMKGVKFLKEASFAVSPQLGSRTIGYVEMVEKEHTFWMGTSDVGDYRTVSLPDGEVLNRYWDHYNEPDLEPTVQPRPEAYHEDIGSYAETKYGQDQATFFRDIRAAAESGWDFSSRWFRPDAVGWDGGIRRGIATIRTTKIVPIDLNALLYGMEQKLFDWTGKPEYDSRAHDRRKAILKYFWNDELGWFFDHCVDDGPTDVWSLAGAYPLFTKVLDPKTDQDKIDRMVRNIRERFLRAGGVVTTLCETGHQWDYPNGWAPLQWIVVRGLLNYADLKEEYRQLALEIAKRFVGCVGRNYLREGRVMEKYNVCEPEATAGGGEYVVQHGFGWTNGVVKAFMVEFRGEMEADEKLKRHLG